MKYIFIKPTEKANLNAYKFSQPVMPHFDIKQFMKLQNFLENVKLL